MNDGLVISVDYDTAKAETKIRKLQRDYDNAKKDIENQKIKMDLTSENLEKTKQKVEVLKTELEEIRKINKEKSISNTLTYGDRAAYADKKAELEKQLGILARQQVEYNKQEATFNKLNAKTKNIGDQILLNTRKQNKFTRAFDKSQKSADRFGRRLKSLIASALFFSVVTKAFTALRNEFGKLITETGTKTAKLVAQLNGSLAVLGRTLYEGARPYIEWILDKLVKMVNILTNGLAKILGKNVNEMKKLAQNTKKAGEEAKKTTAGFDTIQTLDYSSGDSNKGSSADFGALNDDIDSETAMLMMILSGALLVLGVILTFTGANIPLGLGLIVAGALGLATTLSASWNELPQKTKDTITVIMAIVSGALLVLGVILAFTGVAIPLGIALMALGVIGLVTVAKLGWNELPQNTKNTIAIITAIVSGALLVLGVILAFTGAAIPLGIALIVLGAAGLVASYKVAWNTLPQKTKDTVSTIMAIGGALMLVLGIILCFCGVFPLGIGLIVAGAGALVGSVALNWDAFKDKIKSLASAIGKIFVNCWEGIKTGFKAMVNGIIWFANKWIDGLNLLLLPIRGLIFGIAKAFGSDIKFDNVKIPHIPKLATGAVIPGGSPFFAMLGDQPKGKTNIEAPEELIRQIVREETGGKELVIKATGNMSQLIRLLKLELDSESRRASVF